MKINQHDENGTAAELGAAGMQFPETKINSPGIHMRCQQTLTSLLRSVAGLPSLDDNILVENIDKLVARSLLQKIESGESSIVVAQRRGDVFSLVISPTTDR